MKFLSASEIAQQWGLSVTTVRKYCAGGRIAGAFRDGTAWAIPADAVKPQSVKRMPTTLLGRLAAEMASRMPGGIYHRIQIDLTYNSNHMEGSRLTHDQTRHIFETRTLVASADVLLVDDIIRPRTISAVSTGLSRTPESRLPKRL